MVYTINPRDFIHDNDKRAMDALKSIPAFDQFVKAYMKIFNERSMRILNMSSKVKLSPEQCPRIYNLLPPICEKMNIAVPDIYLELNRDPNAYTSGDTYIFITVTTGLLELMNDDEIQTVLAHECGHIICHHVLYSTMGRMILNGAVSMLGLGGLVNTALSTAFAYWMRCSEFSADRAAAVFCGEANPVIDVMLRLAGGSKEVAGEINAELFMNQALEYANYVSDSKWNRVLEFLALMNVDHPFLTVRASSIREWCEQDTFRRIMASLNPVPLLTDGVSCPRCGAPIQNNWAFCRKCGLPLNRSQEPLNETLETPIL